MRHKIYILLILTLPVAGTVAGQCPGPAVRTALINLQRANTTLTTNTTTGPRAGQFGLTDTCGNQRYQYYTRVLDSVDCICCNPITTPVVGASPSAFVKICNTDSIFYIDWKRDPIFLGEALTITQILDSLQNDTSFFNNWYTRNDTTTSLLRTAYVLKSAEWIGLDPTGFMRMIVGDLAYSQVYADANEASIDHLDATGQSVVRTNTAGVEITTSQSASRAVTIRTDTVNTAGSFDPTNFRVNFNSDNSYLYADSLKVVGLGQFPAFPALAGDGTDKGYFYDPLNEGILLTNGDGNGGARAIISAGKYGTFDVSAFAYSPDANTVGLRIGANNGSFSTLNLNPGGGMFGSLVVDAAASSINNAYFDVRHEASDTNLLTYFGMGTTGKFSGQYGWRAFAIGTQQGPGFYKYISVDLPNDTLLYGDEISFYNYRYKLPNKFPNQTTAISDSTFLLAWKRNGTGPYDYTPIFVSKPMLGSGGSGGIYGGSGNVPDGTIASLVDDFEFSGPDISSYTVTTGTSTGGQYFQNFSGATLTHRDTSGSSSLAMSGTGALFSFGDGSTDRLTIGNRDARYSGDYSGTYSARSLIDKGYADATYLPDSDWTTGFSSATQATSSWTATNAATNVNAAIVAKGTGATLAQIPDGSSTGGNSRGIYASDLQKIRTNASDVASGDYSTIPGGRRCTASGTYSFATGFRGVASGNGSVAFGGSGAFSLGATASGTNSFAMGPGATASGVNSWAYGAGFTATAEKSIGFLASSDKYGEFAGNGFSFMRLNKTAIVGAGATELFLDGASLKATIPSGEKWVVEIACLAEISVVGDGTGGLALDDTYAVTYRCVIANKGGTTALVGTVQADMAAQADATMSDAVFTITADNTGDYLKVTYTGGANTGSGTQTNAYANLRVFKY